MLGSAEVFYVKGEEAVRKGDMVMARVNYDMAARIEICYEHQSKVREYLTLADKASETSELHRRYEVLLASLDEVMKIAASYLSSVKSWTPKGEEVPQVPIAVMHR